MEIYGSVLGSHVVFKDTGTMSGWTVGLQSLFTQIFASNVQKIRMTNSLLGKMVYYSLVST